MLILRLCFVIVASQHLVDARQMLYNYVQVHDFMKFVWPQAYE